MGGFAHELQSAPRQCPFPAASSSLAWPRVTCPYDLRHRTLGHSQLKIKGSFHPEVIAWPPLFRECDPKLCARCPTTTSARFFGVLPTVTTCRCWCNPPARRPAVRWRDSSPRGDR